MSEDKHTPEPWKLIADSHSEIVIDVEGNEIHVGRNQANARRIVACVNACAGVPTEVLEMVGSCGGFGRDVMVQHVTKQRDELLASLEKFIDSHEECTDFDGFTAQIVSMDDYHEAQEAIANVKGGAI